MRDELQSLFGRYILLIWKKNRTYLNQCRMLWLQYTWCRDLSTSRSPYGSHPKLKIYLQDICHRQFSWYPYVLPQVKEQSTVTMIKACALGRTRVTFDIHLWQHKSLLHSELLQVLHVPTVFWTRVTWRLCSMSWYNRHLQFKITKKQY